MKRVHKSLLWITGMLVLSGIGFLIHDEGRPERYLPQPDISFLQRVVQDIPTTLEDANAEVTLKSNGFNGILLYACFKQTVEEIDQLFSSLCKNEFDGTLYTLPDGESEVFVGAARYTPLLEAFGYGWWDRHGNLYASIYGEEAAKGKPNFRNSFRFTIRRQTQVVSFFLFCNTSDAECALQEALHYITQAHK